MARVTYDDVIGDGKPQIFDFELTDPAGNVVAIGVKAISEPEYQGIMDTVQAPPVPEAIVRGADGKPKREFLYDDPGYQAKMTDVRREQTRRLMAACLDMGFPGDTYAEKAKAVAKLPSWLQIGAMRLVLRVMGIDDQAIERRAETFRPV